MTGQEIGYLVGAILTAVCLVPLIWALTWQLKMKKREKRSDFKPNNQTFGLNRYYNTFLFYILTFALTADVLGFIILVAFLAVGS